MLSGLCDSHFAVIGNLALVVCVPRFVSAHYLF
jgi:hypothetical protein